MCVDFILFYIFCCCCLFVIFALSRFIARVPIPSEYQTHTHAHHLYKSVSKIVIGIHVRWICVFALCCVRQSITIRLSCYCLFHFHLAVFVVFVAFRQRFFFSLVSSLVSLLFESFIYIHIYSFYYCCAHVNDISFEALNYFSTCKPPWWVRDIMKTKWMERAREKRKKWAHIFRSAFEIWADLVAPFLGTYTFMSDNIGTNGIFMWLVDGLCNNNCHLIPVNVNTNANVKAIDQWSFCRILFLYPFVCVCVCKQVNVWPFEDTFFYLSAHSMCICA